MALEGLATAIYQRKDGQHVVSSAVVSSENSRDIFLERSTQTDIDPSAENTNARNALMTVLHEISNHRILIEAIDDDKSMIVPLPIVHGFARNCADEARYIAMIHQAFPEYFSGSKAPSETDDANETLAHLFLSYYLERGPKLADAPNLSPALYDYRLTIPDAIDTKRDKSMNPDRMENALLLSIFNAAKEGNRAARKLIEEYTRADARGVIRGLHQQGIFETTRFIQTGLHSDAFKDAIQYTYLGWDNLKDIFVQQVVAQQSQKHNVCVKTADDAPSPAFVDITATYLADAEMFLQHQRTQQVEEFRNVFAKRR